MTFPPLIIYSLIAQTDRTGNPGVTEKTGRPSVTAMIREPEEKFPCVGCGYCCIRNTCAFGAVLHPEAGDRNCPELEWTGARYVCRLMAPDHPLADFYRHELQSGGGCRSFNNPWRRDVRRRTEEEARAVVGGTPWPGPDYNRSGL
ncbi:MAG TPA: hypothetical protein PLU95_11305 [Syntrophales bacterium]|nr:hypothetical protein [Syntrophales bacterium]